MSNNQALSAEELRNRLVEVPVGAQLLGIQENTAWNWLAQGRLKRCRIGRRTFLDRRQIEEILLKALEGK